MSRKAIVAGVGMIPFAKPGASKSYDEMGAEATSLALRDAGVNYSHVQQAVVGYVFGESTCGQAALYRVGLSGIPVFNVNNNCSTGSSALFLARQMVASGSLECALALGFEQMQPGALRALWDDRVSPFRRFDLVCDEINPYPEIPVALRYFGGAGKEYMETYGVGPELFAKVRVKASRHAEHNPFALFRKVVSEEEVLQSPLIFRQRDSRA
jgi:acetyl-CoA acetyltransferase